jgi:SagB-type dehydrogenase family enzyme
MTLFAGHPSLRLLLVTAAAGTLKALGPGVTHAAAPAAQAPASVVLPAPRRDSSHSLERALATRRSVREFRAAPLALEQVSQLLWAAQGEVSTGGHRTAPSAGALYPLEVYLAAGKVSDLAAGVYRYRPAEHRLALVAAGDLRRDFAAAALHQGWIETAAAVVVIAAAERRTTGKYGERGVRYVQLEAGHAAQNVLLQAVAVGAGATVVGAFSDDAVHALAGLKKDERALYLIPVGVPR